MREILFRGKREDNGEWIFGSLHIEYGEADRNGSQRLNYRILGMRGECDYVEPETVGQYTGLTDKNGTKIFEGDIVDCWGEGVNAKGTVQQRIDGLWIIYPAWQKELMWNLCPDKNGKTTVEIIGNIHDNPELIGGTEDGD